SDYGEPVIHWVAWVQIPPPAPNSTMRSSSDYSWDESPVNFFYEFSILFFIDFRRTLGYAV
ncbi:MAG: hypothetical protein O2V44_07580, partial [Candidatus Bathyarchaeota archaeon]|nr:hypothetical protein [Candidatus Bathyarchaeota archaeon]